ncbi:hypothetical protein TWF679_002271 [Orbilia oligospora]|uniref:Uncharacterized protein n=1 Tax=Orbilia oligospora TaxID=2813651 RepID=A0A8H8VGC7_ORBOL|nr:hypothetical protein TWF679_002271 [Orbilia oligospora]
MPRRGLFRQANQFGVFDQLGNPLPPQQALPLPAPPGQPQLVPGPPAAATPNPDNLEEMLAAVMPGAFPQFEEGEQVPAAPPAGTPQVPQVPQPVQPNIPLPQQMPLVRKQNRFRRLLNHMHNREFVAQDFHAPPAQKMSWTEVRSKLGAPAPPPDRAKTLYEWDRVRYRMGIRPTFEYMKVAQEQQEQARLQNQAATQQGQWNGQFPQVPLQPVAGPAPAPAAQQPANSPYLLVQTPQGPMYIPQPPAPGTQNPLTGQPTENPWSQQDAKSLATALFLSGMKLTWNAATSMWDAVTAAYNQNFEDRVKLRDQTNQWVNECVRRGYAIPAQRYHQQYGQPGGWPQWGATQPQQPQQQGPIPQQPFARRWP